MGKRKGKKTSSGLVSSGTEFIDRGEERKGAELILAVTAHSAVKDVDRGRQSSQECQKGRQRRLLTRGAQHDPNIPKSNK